MAAFAGIDSMPTCSLRDMPDTAPRVPAATGLTEEQLAEQEELVHAAVTPEIIDATLAALTPFKDEFPGVEIDRWTARRLAVANGGDVDGAVRQLRASQEWLAAHRAAVDAHDVGAEALFFRRGYDRLGHPVLIWNGRVHKAAERTPEEVAVAAAAAAGEALAVLRRQGLHKFTLIIHLPRGTEMDWRMGKEVLRTLQRNYPERLYRALIFPCGFWTQVAWNVLKVVVDVRTRQKLQFLNGNDPESFQEWIAPEQLPRQFGGEDPMTLPKALRPPTSPRPGDSQVPL
eukprot:CAMPEP_0118859778 /NCGR_PEP_ID=MMETSP1163-20130328/5882_1 /TAXON_ID=124430 /ORGANISM="Phaeomonas parva, Strain CCMP2877" /LENGTH=286 /DNA_ID=CAMNT_0006793411 /DNA_START=198 /DNA_END=1058 /DNA_ORIENTATION=-